MKYVPPLNALPGDEEDEDRAHWNADPSGENLPLREGAYPSAIAFNALQREIVNAIVAAGLEPDPLDYTQLAEAIGALAIVADDSVTLAKLAHGTAGKVIGFDGGGAPAEITLTTVAAGVGAMFYGSTPPTGWLECDGAAVSRTTYEDLYNAIGTTFGVGDGATTFNVPDMRGEFARGWDHGRGVDSGRSLGSFQDFAIENITGTFGATSGNFIVDEFSGAFYSQGSHGYAGSNNNSGSFSDIGFSASNVVNTASETRPRNVATMFCIKY